MTAGGISAVTAITTAAQGCIVALRHAVEAGAVSFGHAGSTTFAATCHDTPLLRSSESCLSQTKKVEEVPRTFTQAALA